MDSSWLYTTPSAIPNKRVHRLGLAANYGIEEDGVRAAMDRGVNLFLWTRRAGGLKSPLREALAHKREDVVVVGYVTLGWFGWGVRSGAEGLLKELGTDYVDVLLLGWLGIGAAWTGAVEKELVHLRESGKVRGIGASIHDRPRAGKMAESAALDLLMIRYNAAHPGAEKDVFPHLGEARPGVVSYTATSWGQLLDRSLIPAGERLPSSTDCYRFVMSSPHVDALWTGPKNGAELDAALDALDRGPMSDEDIAWMRRVGVAVRDRANLQSRAVGVADRLVNLVSGFGFRSTGELPRE